jgi:hypothetical protein
MTFAQVGAFLLATPYHLLKSIAIFGGELVSLVCVAESEFEFA